MSDSPTPDSPAHPILVPVDFSPPARAALIAGARLAMCTGAALKVLHVVHAPADRPDYYQRRSERDILLPVEELANRMFAEFLHDTYQRNPELTVLEAPSTLLVTGLPSTRIPEVARLVDASQIVMGQQRATGMFRNLRAPLSERIANRCGIPVTVVYSDASPAAAARRPRERFGPVDANAAPLG
ncbi:MAG: universal stress protein [Chromatiaceae bacterium]|nr:universal stress protein [Chromatiaceae bacterium]